MARTLAKLSSAYPRLRFCATFALYIGSMAVLFSNWQHLCALVYMQPIAIVAAAALNLVGIPASLDLGTIHLGYCLIEMPGVDFRVIHECTGIFTLAIYLAIVMAYPAAKGRRLGGAVLGCALFFLYGSFRLVILGVLAESVPGAIQALHQGIMVLANIGFAVFVLQLWLSRAQGGPARD